MPMVWVVNFSINKVSSEKIRSDLVSAQKSLNAFFAEKSQGYADAIDSLVLTQPTVRASLATTKADADDLFGEENTSKSDEDLAETNELLASTLEHLPIFIRSEVFAVVDSSGTLLFSKAFPKKYGINISDLPVIRSALIGTPSKDFWASTDKLLNDYYLVEPGHSIFQIFIKPVKFNNEVKGLVIVGLAITNKIINELKDFARADLAFIVNESLVLMSDENQEAKEYLRSYATGEGRFFIAKEEFISLKYPITNSLNKEVGSTLLYRSKTKEQQFYRDLQQTLIWIGAIAAAIAIFAAIFLSIPVTNAIRSLIRGAKAVRNGNLDYQVQVKSKDEFLQLADSFNDMTKGLKEKETIKSTFKRYVSSKVVDTLLQDNNKMNLGGDNRKVTILFSDIVGFTRISEELSPKETVDFLNQYLGEMSEIIHRSDGIVDKYIGDAIMAYWIDADDGKTGAQNACEVAIEQMQKLNELAEKWKNQDALRGFKMRIGIHVGHVIMGNIGSKDRMDYTIIGDNVNLAARLESLNKLYGTQIIISESVSDLIENKFILRELDKVQVVGKNEAVKIFELLDPRENEKDNVIDFYKALDHYRKGNFSEAKSEFKNTSTHRETTKPQKFLLIGVMSSWKIHPLIGMEFSN